MVNGHKPTHRMLLYIYALLLHLLLFQIRNCNNNIVRSSFPYTHLSKLNVCLFVWHYHMFSISVSACAISTENWFTFDVLSRHNFHFVSSHTPKHRERDTKKRTVWFQGNQIKITLRNNCLPLRNRKHCRSRISLPIFVTLFAAFSCANCGLFIKSWKPMPLIIEHAERQLLNHNFDFVSRSHAVFCCA